MTRPIQARIDSAALAHNLEVARRHAFGAAVIAVIKANGYGHGLLRVAAALAGAEGFAVLDLDDAVRLRQAGFRQRIVLLEGFFGADELAAVAENGLTAVIHCFEQIELLRSARLAVKPDVLIKINSGMNRLGFAPHVFPAALEALRAQPLVGDIALMTHFASADEAEGVAAQLACFQRLAQGMALPRCLANSAALLRYPEARGEWVRPGIMLYGASPFADASAAQLGLRPAMTLQSRIIAVQELQPGERVGYGGTFTAEQRMRIGIVACGYADGYPRHAPTGTPVRVAGMLTRTLGRVSMDMLCVDLSAVPRAAVGSAVTLWGEELPVEQVARSAGTISYELLCALAPRVPVVEARG